MNNRIRVDVNGVDRVIAALQGFQVKARDLQAAWADIGAKVKTDAVVIAPKLTGRLSASVRAGKAKSRAVVRAGKTSIPYAGVIHYGGYNNIKAQPFLVVSVENNRSYAVNRLDREISTLIRQFGLN